MKFNQTNQVIADDSVIEDSSDNLDCFGEFSKEDKICTTYCSYSIRCAIEQSQNPRVDILDHILTMDFFPAKIH
ncbi:MAG: hypothetical protein GY737_06155 [Desulfobacteraceae bacterium]|nr:hypothetical protein [Desulfobacteraceae bacterium]